MTLCSINGNFSIVTVALRTVLPMQRGEISNQGKSTNFSVDTVCSSLDEAPQGTNME